MLEISKTEMKKIREHAEKEYPKECCGVLLGNKHQTKVQEIYQARNVDTTDRQKLHFVINPLELYRVEKEAEKRKMEIIGFYHSHADYPAVLSEEDKSSMLSQCLYMVVSVENGVCTDIKSYRKTRFSGNVCEIYMDYLKERRRK